MHIERDRMRFSINNLALPPWICLTTSNASYARFACVFCLCLVLIYRMNSPILFRDTSWAHISNYTISWFNHTIGSVLVKRPPKDKCLSSIYDLYYAYGILISRKHAEYLVCQAVYLIPTDVELYKDIKQPFIHRFNFERLPVSVQKKDLNLELTDIFPKVRHKLKQVFNEHFD